MVLKRVASLVMRCPLGRTIALCCSPPYVETVNVLLSRPRAPLGFGHRRSVAVRSVVELVVAELVRRLAVDSRCCSVERSLSYLGGSEFVKKFWTGNDTKNIAKH